LRSARYREKNQDEKAAEKSPHCPEPPYFPCIVQANDTPVKTLPIFHTNSFRYPKFT